MRTDIYKVTQIGKGFLALMSKPVINEWVEEWYASISIYGVKRFISLLEPYEISHLGLTDEPWQCQNHAIDYINVPIPKQDLLDGSEGLSDLINIVFSDIKLGINTVIHCDNGIERTSLFAAAILVKQGFTLDEAFKKIACAGGMKISKTSQQYRWLFKRQRFLLELNSTASSDPVPAQY